MQPKLRQLRKIALGQRRSHGLQAIRLILNRRQHLGGDAGAARVARSGWCIQPGLQLLLQVGKRAGQQSQALGHRLAPYLQRVGQCTDTGILNLRGIQGGEQASSLVAQASRRLGRQNNQRRRVARCLLGVLRPHRKILLDHHMRIHAAEAEGTDARAAWHCLALLIAQSRPVALPVDNVERTGIEIDAGIQLLEVHQARQGLLAHRQNDLDHASQTGHRLQVAHIGLYAAHAADMLGQRLAALLRHACEGQLQALDLDWVAFGRAGAVGLDISQGADGEIRLAQRFRHHLRLGLRVGISHRARPSAMVARRATHYRQNVILILQRLGERFEQHHGRPFAAYIAVGALVERFAAAVRRQHAGLREGNEMGRAAQDADTAHQRLLAFPAADRMHCLVQRHQRA
nr:hypothetical protein [Pseudoduganella violaceinigra]